MGAGREHQRPAYPEVGEKHLAQLAIQELSVLIDGERHVLRRKALHLGAERVSALERDEGRAQRRDRMTEIFGKGMACAGRAGERIGFAARADRRRAAGEIALPGHDAGHGPVFGNDLLGCRFE